MKTLSITLTSLAVLSLSACATFTASPQDALLAGIAAENIKPLPSDDAAADAASASIDLNPLSVVAPDVVLAESQIRSTFTDPTCGQFSMNTLAFAATPELPTGGASLGTGILKTLIMGTIAGAASGGVASLGIGSAFIETAVAGTANQIVFNGTRPIVDKVIPDIGVSVTSAEKMTEIKTAAERLGCAEPSWAGKLSTIEAGALLTKLNAEGEAARAAEKAALEAAEAATN